VSRFTTMLTEEPGMILFLMAVLKNEPELILNSKLTSYLFDTKIFFKQIEQEIEKGNIRKVDPDQFYLCLLSLILFPFSILDIISENRDYSSTKGITRYLKAHKDTIVLMIT